MIIQNKYDQWVERVCAFIEEVGPIVNGSSSAMQSPPVLNGKCRILFLGHDAHEGTYERVNRERFYEGNSTFKEAHRNWHYWRRPYQSFQRIGHGDILDSGNTMLMNLFYFGNDDINRANAKMGLAVMNQCIQFTNELVCDIIKPKVVVCFSVGSVFNPLRKLLTDVKPITLADGIVVMQGYWDNIPVIGMTHPSARSISNRYFDTVFKYVTKISL